MEQEITYCMKCMMPLGTDGVCPCCGYAFDKNAEKPPHILPSGTILRDRFLLGEPLGQGGFGITYIGRDLVLDIRVAVKEYFPAGYVSRSVGESFTVHPMGESQKDFIEKGKTRFLQEAKVLAQLHRISGVVEVRDFFEENGTAYIVMEYLEGEDLRNVLKRRKFSAEEIFTLMDPVFHALEKVHAKNIIHRDISPDNIMMLTDGTLTLMDFGAARLANFSDQRSISVVLKAGYAPEEQYRAKGKQGPWTDIYALCVTIYKCITGITPDDALERLVDDQIKWPSELGYPITVEQENVLKKGMSVIAKDRFQSLGELIAALNVKKDSDKIHQAEIGSVNKERSDKGLEKQEEIQLEKTVYDTADDSDKTVYESGNESEATVYEEPAGFGQLENGGDNKAHEKRPQEPVNESDSASDEADIRKNIWGGPGPDPKYIQYEKPKRNWKAIAKKILVGYFAVVVIAGLLISVGFIINEIVKASNKAKVPPQDTQESAITEPAEDEYAEVVTEETAQPTTDEVPAEDVIKEEETEIELNGPYETGDTIVFGKYEQDGDLSNDKESIEWIVLDVKDNKILVISQYALADKKYQEGDGPSTWEASSLRAWLNSTFIEDAFSEKERGKILDSSVPADPNPDYETDPGSNTTDKVFILSIQELEQYLSSDEERICIAAKGSKVVNFDGKCFWWARNPGHSQLFAVLVGSDGKFSEYGYFAIDKHAVRPAMWIEINP